MSRRKTNLTEDELIDSLVNPARFKQARLDSRLANEIASDSLKPMYDSNSIPLEVGRGNNHTKFKYKPTDYSRGRDSMSEDEIIDSVLHPTRKVKRHSHGVMEDIRANVSPEVRKYWLTKIGSRRY